MQEQLSECTKSITVEPEPVRELAAAMVQNQPTQLSAVEPKVTPQTNPERTTEHGGIPLSDTTSHTIGAASYISPPEVQRMVAEHIMRSPTAVSKVNMSFRLRGFFGRNPCPSHEADFDTWCNSVALILQDTRISDLQRSRKVLDSL